jgi:hypothetical protein
MRFCTVAVNDFYQLTVKACSLGGPYAFGVSYKMISGVVDEDTLRSAVEEFETNAIPLLQGCTAIDADLDQITMEPESGVDEVPGLMQLITRPGTMTGDSLPNNVAAIIHQLTDAPSAKCNGRIFLAGVSESEMDSQLFSAAYVAAAQLFATELEENLVVTGPPAATFQPVVISRVLDGAPRVPPVAFNILSNTVRNTPRQQRRRTTTRFGVS